MTAVLLLVVVLLSLAGEVCWGAKYTRTVSYEGEILVKCSGLSKEVIQNLIEGDHSVDVWYVGTGGSVDFRISSEEFQKIKGDLPECREERSVEELVREMEMRMNRQSLNQTKQEWFEEYHRYNEIVDWWKKLAEDSSQIVKFVKSIGESLEGRDQPAIHITSSIEPNVKKIYFQCQIHAREWISGATCMYVANELVQRYNNGDELLNVLLKQVEIIYVPFVNPDGYEYTWTNDRLWRKNMALPPTGSTCYGVDLNRNYNDHWGGGGSSGSPCSETYRGPGAASEPETKNTQNYFKSSGNMVGAIDWHSFSQLILRPYGWTSADSKDEYQLKELGDKMSEDISNVHGKRYTSQKSIQLYMTTGSASDWFYSDDANGNNDYRAAGFTIELRDKGDYGFELPAEQIVPNGEELVPAVIRFIEELQAKPLEK